MKIRPSNSGAWFYLPGRHNPDKDYLNWIYNYGEFSMSYENTFEKHLKTYGKLNKIYAHLNGQKLKAVLKNERPYFGMSGLEELVYK
jgi:hypothetical protein